VRSVAAKPATEIANSTAVFGPISPFVARHATMSAVFRRRPRPSDRPIFRTRFMRAGVYYVLAILAMGVASGARPNNLLIWVFSALIAAFLVSGVVSGFMMLGVRGVRIEPRRGRVGEPLVIRYELRNRARFLPVYDVAIAENVDRTRLEAAGDAWVLHVGPGDVVHAEAVFRPLRRGPVRLGGFELASTFPFGLLKKVLRFTQQGDVLIHPEIRPIRDDLLVRVTARAAGGDRMSRSGGGADDFFGIREYRPGDSIRHIAWKRLAGTGKLATIERGRAVPPRLRVLLDLRAPTDRLRVAEGEDPRALEERAIVLAASFISLADRLGYEYALSVAGVAIPAVPLRKGHFHREKIMSLLATIDLDAARVPGNGLSTSDERAMLVCIHPDRADASIAPDASWHFTARQYESVVARGPAADRGAPEPKEAVSG
jgi:uncharacterized protein (DUF58 family)